MFKILRIGLALFALVAMPVGVAAAGLQSDSSTIDSAAQSNYAQFPSSYKLVTVSDPNKSIPGNMGSFVLPGSYDSRADHSLELNVLPEGLFTYYPFNTGSGEQTYDDSITHSTARLINGTSWVPGILQNALAFDGKDDYVSGEFAESLKSTSTTTWSAWIRPSDVDRVTQDQMILSMQGANNLRLFGRKLFGSFKINGQAESVSGITALENNKWYHVVSTYDGSSLRLYLNGSLEAELSNLSGKVELDTGSFEVGRWQASDPRYYHGAVDEVKLYSRAINSDEVKLEYGANLGGVSSAQPLFQIQPGASQVSQVSGFVISDASASQFSLHQDRPLTQVGGSAYISSISGSTTDPQEWSEGTTNGIGFSWINSGLSKWGRNPNYRYSSISNQQTVLTSIDNSLIDKLALLTLQYRVDVSEDTPVAVYTNRMIYNVVLKP